ncbi:hypothetical protein ACUN0C_09095 [Faunimonas sp. B44]|uniref:hypothetical protein n=1 Tax=Faunimonas sp. B44 TaxID=3461493 RepID=UPI0040441CCA
MIRFLLTGAWVCAVTVASSYFALQWKLGSGPEAGGSPLAGVSLEKTRAISVPMIADGRIQGYVVAQFAVTVDSEKGGRLPVPTQAFVIDEAFRAIYSDPTFDFRNLARYDLAALTRSIAAKVNARLADEVVREILVEEFNFVPKSEVPS